MDNKHFKILVKKKIGVEQHISLLIDKAMESAGATISAEELYTFNKDVVSIIIDVKKALQEDGLDEFIAHARLFRCEGYGDII